MTLASTATLPQERLQFSGAAPILLTDAPRVARHIRAVLSRWPQTEPAPGATPTRITRQGTTYTVETHWLDTPLEGLTDVAAACGAVVDTAQAFLDAHPEHLCLHSATYEIGGRLVVMTGTGHAGKSTLAARMAAEDVLVYCDDMLPLTGPGNHGLALGLPPRPRLPLPPSRTLAGHVAANTAASDGRYCYLDGPNLAPHGRTAPIGAVILLDRRADGPAGFAPASRAEALRHLMLRNMARSQPAQDIVARFEALVDTVPCLSLYYSDLDAVAALLMRSFGAWPCDPARLTANQPEPGAPRTLEGSTRERAPLHPADAVMVRSRAVASRRIGEETFLFDAGGTSVYTLNPLAGAIWTLLEEPHSARDVAAILAEVFPDTDQDTILRDTRLLFADLTAHAVIVSPAG